SIGSAVAGAAGSRRAAAPRECSPAANSFSGPCGPPSFGLPTPLLPTSGLQRFVAGDFNKDGKTDLVTLSYLNGELLTFAAGNSAGAFDAPVTSPLDLRFVDGLAMNAADFNRDGKLDLVLLDGFAQKIHVFVGDGAGGFSAPSTYRARPQGSKLLIADFNRDGVPDVATASDYGPQMTVLLGTGTGGFFPETPFSVPGVSSFTQAIGAGDFNGDGKSD